MDEEVQRRVTPVDLDTLTTIYIKIRDKRADNKRAFEAEDNELKEQMEWALSSTWIDTDDDGKVGVSELGGPKSIVLVRS